MSLHLSLLSFPRADERWRGLRPYDLHALVRKGADDDDRPLYRHDLDEKRDAHSILVQTEKAPDWSFLPNGTAQTKLFAIESLMDGTRLRFRIRANAVRRRSKRYYEERGDAENPRRDAPAYRHVPLGAHREWAADQKGVTPDEIPDREAQLVAWLAAKGEGDDDPKGTPGGFEFVRLVGPDGGDLGPACAVGAQTTLRVRRPSRNGRGVNILTFHGSELTGLLRITDAGRFAETVRRGIGRGKAFGFGLLSLAPAG